MTAPETGETSPAKENDSWGGHRNLTLGFLVGLLALLSVFAFQVARPFLWPLIAAVILAVAFHPIHAKYLQWTRRPSLAAALSLFTAILLTLLPAIGVTTVVSRELGDLYSAVSARSSAQGGWLPFFSGLWERVGTWLAAHLPVRIDTAEIERQALRELQGFSGKALANLAAFVGGFATFVFRLILTYFILFFLFRDGARMVRSGLESLPIAETTAERLLQTARETLAANLYGVLGVALGQGALLAIGLTIIGFPSPMMWGIVAGLFSMVPLIGTMAVWVPIAIVLLFQASYGKALILTVWGLAVVGMSDNVIRPLVVMGRVKQHPLLILFSILGGTQAFGFLGLLLGPVVVTLTMAVFATLRVAVLGEEAKNARLPQVQIQPAAAGGAKDSA